MDNYIEMIVEGPYFLVKGYVLGFLEGLGGQPEIFFNKEEWIRTERRTERFMEMVGLHGELTHLVVPERIHSRIEALLQGRLKDWGLEIKGKKKIDEAVFDFKFNVFGVEYARGIRALFDTPPRGVEVSGYTPVEKVRSDAEGAEGYAPMHHYSFSGGGTVSGPFHDVLGMFRQARDNPLVRVEYMNLLTEDQQR